MKKIIYLLSLIVLTSCMPYGYLAKYDVKLSIVEFPADAKVQYGQYKTSHCDNNHTYKDGNIAASWKYEGDLLYLKLDNKTQHTLPERRNMSFTALHTRCRAYHGMQQ